MYINPQATGKQILFVSRIGVVAFGFFMGILAIILNAIGLSLGWVYLFMGVLIGSGVFPVWYCMTWRKCTAAGAIAGAFVGQACGIVTWLAYTAGVYGMFFLHLFGM
jgi:Na+/proline symporter